MANIRVMLVDDNVELRTSFRTYLEKQDGITICAECGNGLEALRWLEKQTADVIILDIIMPQMDGYGFLEALNRRYSGVGSARPQVIVVSALGRDDFITRAVELGARYYMIKPIELAALAKRVKETSEEPLSPSELIRTPTHMMFMPPDHAPTMDEKLASLFLTIGIPAHIKGYQFLREAVKMVVDNPDIINRITKELYPGIAHHFGTSASKVERAIRHAIEVAWSRGRIDTLNKAFGCKVATKEDKPTNGEFIAMIADKLALEQRSAS